jgi:hypothetical protein
MSLHFFRHPFHLSYLASIQYAALACAAEKTSLTILRRTQEQNITTTCLHFIDPLCTAKYQLEARTVEPGETAVARERR